MRSGLCVLLLVPSVLPSFALAVDPWADRVLSYNPGLGVASGYDVPGRALGSPTRFTGVLGGFPGAVTPFNPAWGTDEILSIGGGGSLVLAFDEPVANDPLNPFGVDLIVFGNAGLIDDDFPMGTATPTGAMFGVGAAPFVEVSADGLDWRPVFSAIDSLFPTLGYLDLSDPYALSPGLVPSDFTRPVNPALSLAGLSYPQILAAYNGSGGGTGIDIAPTGLAAVSFVRFTNLSDGPVTFEIDALADVSPVPAPGALAPAIALLAARRLRREP
jgi:hypothetical protein